MVFLPGKVCVDHVNVVGQSFKAIVFFVAYATNSRYTFVKHDHLAGAGIIQNECDIIPAREK
jgi:hypothetical protein